HRASDLPGRQGGPPPRRDRRPARRRRDRRRRRRAGRRDRLRAAARRGHRRRAARGPRRRRLRRALPVPQQQPPPGARLPLPGVRRGLPDAVAAGRRLALRQPGLRAGGGPAGGDGRLPARERLGPRRRRAGRAGRGRARRRVPGRARVGADGLARAAQPADVAHPRLLRREPAGETGPGAGRRRRRARRRALRRGQPRGLVRPRGRLTGPVQRHGRRPGWYRRLGTEHHHLVGPWSSGSLVVGETVHHPGPLYYDLLAPWVRVLGPWVGLAVGVAAINVAASVLAVLAARRIGGPVAMLSVAAAAVGLQYAMGSELLYDVWQPNALVLPYLALLVVAAAVAGGDVALVPWVVGLGSLVVQTHVSHAMVVGVACAVALGACVWQVRRAGRPVPWRRPLVAGAVVAVAAWCQPVVEELRDPGDGNLSRLVRVAASGEAEQVGLGRGV